MHIQEQTTGDVLHTHRFFILAAYAAAVFVVTLLLGMAAFYAYGPSLETKINPVSSSDRNERGRYRRFTEPHLLRCT